MKVIMLFPFAFAVPPPDADGEGEPERGEDEDVDEGADDGASDSGEAVHGADPRVAEPVGAGRGFDFFALFEPDVDRTQGREVSEGFELGFGGFDFFADVADVILDFEDVADFLCRFQDFLILGFFEPFLFESSFGISDLGGDILSVR